MSTKSIQSVSESSKSAAPACVESTNENGSLRSRKLDNAEKDEHRYEGCGTEPAVFVCTYHKYNCGESLNGMWVDLSSFDSFDSFHNFCVALHADEGDPEIMLLDYENFPYALYSEDMDEDGFDLIAEFCELDDDKKEAFEAFSKSYAVDIKDFEERYQGKYDSEVAFAEELCDECGTLDAIPENLRCYFDFEKFARDLFMCDYTYIDGFVFCDC